MITFEHDGKNYEVRKPGLEQQREAQRQYNRAFNDAAQSGAILRPKLEDFMRQQSLWDDAKQAEYALLGKQVADNELILAKGGIKKIEARRVGLEIKKLRNKMRDLISVRTELDSHTCEGQAFNARFNYLVSACVVYKDNGKQVYKNFEEYMSRSDERLAFLAAEKLSELIYGVTEDAEMKTEENKVLRKLGYMDEKGRLINTAGHLVDEEGRLINEDGYFVNENGELVDVDGNLRTKEGDYVVEHLPFLDDDGNPIPE